MNKTAAAIFQAIGLGNATMLGLSLTQVYTIFGLVLFILQISVLIGTWVYKLVKYLKDKKLTDEELNDLISDGKEIAEKIAEQSNKTE